MKTYPILQSQMGVLLQSMQHPGSTQYNLPNYLFFPLSMTRERVVKTIQKLIDSFPELHTRFMIGEQGKMRQWSDMSMTIPVVSRKCSEAELEAYIREGFLRPFDPLGGEPLFRAEVVETEKRICLLSDGHHSIVDGMSFAPILASTFAKLMDGEHVEAQPYGMYQAAQDEEASFATDAYQRDKAYYAEKFAGFEMATLNKKQHSVMGKMGRHSTFVSRKQCDDWCQEQGLPVNLLFQAAFSLVIGALTRQDRVAYFTLNHGRMDKRLRNSVGMFVKSVPFLADGSGDPTVTDYIRRLRTELMSTIRHGIYPFTHFCMDLGMTPGVMFNFQALASMEEHLLLGGAEFSAVQPVREEMDGDAGVLIFLKGDSYEIRVESGLAMNDEATLQMLAETIRQAVIQMMAHPEAPLSQITIVTAEEQDALVQLGAGKRLDVDPQMTFVKAFEQCASHHPDRLAVADATDSLTYGELSRRSDVLAHRLTASGVRPNDFVAVMLDRTIDFPLSVIAIHKAGAAYLPIDLEYPEDRQQYMLTDCQAKVVIDRQYIAETDFSRDAAPIDLSSAHGLAYMIYTSGSTGKPKGVVLHQAGLWNFINVIIDMNHLTADERISCHRSFSFDAHIQDLFPVLTLGGSLHIMPECIRRDLAAIRKFLFEHRITGGGYTTLMATLLLNTYNDLPVRFLNTGGEKLAGVYSDHIEIINAYGPTECTNDTSYYRILPGCRVSNIPIGRTVANCYHFIVDKQGRLVPRGAEGELCFAGIQVGRGYWRQPELTAEKFGACPFLPLGSDGQPVRMYRTGDLCRWNSEGQLEYIGRTDDQVKLRGFRIEMGEIEACATRFEGISQAVAVIRPIGNTDTLCLYYVAGDTAVDTDDLRRFLGRTLAEYMVPAAYMQLDALPTTPNGKVDRRHLPEPALLTQKEYVAPQNKTEEVVVRLLGSVLSWSAPISMLDNFISLGGDSIKLIQLVSLLHKEGYTAQVSELMKCSTVRDMASALTSIEEGPDIAQDPVTGAITPGAIQRRFLSWQLAQPDWFIQSMVLRAPKPIDPALLRQTLQALAVHHDMLRATVAGRSIVIRNTTDEHLFALTENIVEGENEVAQTIEEAALREGGLIDLEHGPILRAVLLHAPDGDRLLLVCHHIAIDGVSWRILADDLYTAMNQLEQGQPIALPRKTHSFAYWTDTVSRYRDSYLLQLEKPYWQQVQGQMESMDLTTAGSRQARRLTVTLEGEPLKQLLTTSSKAYNTGINDLLLTALSQSYYRLTGHGGLTIQMEGHGREPLHEAVVTDRTVGWFTSFYPVVIQGITGDIRHDVRTVKEVLRNVPNKGIGYSILQYMESHEGDAMLRTDLMPLVGFNYLGEVTNSDAEIVFTEPLGVPLPSVDINCAIAGGRFVARFDYDAARWSTDQAQQLADSFVAALSRVAAHTSQATTPEPTASDFGAMGWTDGQLQTIIGHLSLRGEQLQRVYPLSPMQEGILITYLSDRDTTAYRLLFRLALEVLPTEAALRHTIDYLAEKHEVLRTAILFEGVPQPCQAIVSRQLGLEMRDLTMEPDIEEAATAVHQEILHRKLSLTDEPLFQLVCMKTGEDSCQLLIFMHHIISDGWCIPIIFKDFLMKLNAETDGRPLPATTEQNGRYEAFIHQLLRRDRKTGLAYWKELLAGYDSQAALPAYGRSAEKDTESTVSHTLDHSLTAALRELAVKSGVTLNTIMELGWGLVLQAFCRTDDVVFLTVVSGRESGDGDNSLVVGPFINSVPVRVHAPSSTTVRQALKELQEQSAQSAAYDFCPLSEILSQTPLGSSLFQSVIAFENFPIDDKLSTLANNKWNIKTVQIEEEPFCELSISIYPEDAGTLSLTFTYDTSLYNGQQMEQVAETYETIMRSMSSMPDGQLGELDIVSEDERLALVELGAGKQTDIDPQMTFVKAFEQCASHHSDRLAVADATDSLTYGELSHRSNVLAHRLTASGVRPNDFVAVKLDRTIDFPLSVIAIHKAGAAYLPIDLEYPEDRQQYMLSDSQAKVVIDRQFIADTDFSSDAAPVDLSAPDGLAYMIYTSGSTGKPKGAMLHHAGLWNLIQANIRKTKMTDADRIASHRSFSFDAHVNDFFPILTLGGSTHIMPEQIRRELAGICHFLVANQITIAGFTASIGKLLLDSYHDLPLRILALGGEKLSHVDSGHLTVLNCYGPTECTNDVTYYAVEPGNHLDVVPIGKTIDNCNIFLVDTLGKLVPRGAIGELCFAGIQVSWGYWQNPEQTAERFCDCPFLPCSADGKPIRMYHTGDLCRWNEEGQLEFIGRADEQVKLRGVRIELGEIETCARRYEGIGDAVAAIKNTGGNDVLCLYYTAQHDISEAALRDYLTQSLTEYMLPMAYMQLEQIPRLPNGKIDRRKLSQPELTQHLENVAPTTEKESLMLMTARHVLGRNDFGTTDDLIALGLTSIGAIKLASIAATSGVRISVNNLMRRRTIARLLDNAQEPGYWYNAYTPDKPVLVVPHGIVYAINMAGKLNRWQQRFSIYAIEPTDEHAERLFPDGDFQTMIDTYAAMLVRDIPREAHVKAFVGYSWGGEQAYWLASRWQELRGECASVYLGDSHMHNRDYVKMSDEAIAKETMAFASQYNIDLKAMDQNVVQAALQLAVKKVGTAERMHCGHPFPKYDGHVTFFNALKDNPDVESNLELWRGVAPRLKVVDVDDNHLNFVLGDEYIDLVTEELFNDIKGA